MDQIHFPYRSSSHLAFLHVVAEVGLVGAARSRRRVRRLHQLRGRPPAGGRRQRRVRRRQSRVHVCGAPTRGDQVALPGPDRQPPVVMDHRLVVRADSGIDQVSDLKEKVVATRGNHPGLNNWLFLKQNGLDQDRDDVKLERIRGGTTWEAVRDGKADAALVNPPVDLFAQRAGPEGHPPEPPSHGLVHHHVQRTPLRRPEPGHRRALPQGRLSGHRLLQDPSRGVHQDHPGTVSKRGRARPRGRHAPCGKASRRS